jgi:hypothetical protein
MFGDSQALLELRKAREVAEHRVAQDQQAPPFATSSSVRAAEHSLSPWLFAQGFGEPRP